MTKNKVKLIAAKKTSTPLQDKVDRDLKATIEHLTEVTTQYTTKIPKPKGNREAARQKYVKQWRAIAELYRQMGKSLPTVAELADKNNVPLDMISRGKGGKEYSYGYMVEADNLIKYDSDTQSFVWNDNLADNESNLKKYFNIIDLTRPSIAPMLVGATKALDLYLVSSASKSGNTIYPSVYFYIAMKVDFEDFIPSLKALGTAETNYARVMNTAFQALLLGKPIPNFFSIESDLKKQVEPGPYVAPSGSLLYIPDMKKSPYKDYSDRVKEVLAEKPSKDGYVSEFPKSVIIFPDEKTNNLIRTNNGIQLSKDERTSPGLDSVSLVGIAKPDTRYKLHLLEWKISNLPDQDAGSLGSYLHFNSDGDCYTYWNKLDEGNPGRTVGEVLSDPNFAKFINAAIAYGESKYGQGGKMANWMAYMASLHILKDLIKTGPALFKEVAEKKRKFAAVKPKDCPALPNIREDGVNFPHQAEALAKLDIAVDSAIIDISTGGGKAGIIIKDCLNLMQKGLVKRPLVVMPNALVAQFISEIAEFTDGTVNGYALTSEVEKVRGLENIERDIENAPRNTIYVASFPFLTKGGAFKDKDIGGDPFITYEKVQWLQQFEFDYLAVDESQNIKNTTSNAHQALCTLGRGIQYKRIATGTLISNKPTDLVGQMKFLDPLLLGTKKEFNKKYTVGANGKTWISGFAEIIRERLKEGSSYIMYREQHWASLLPKKLYSMERVEMTPEHKAIYDALVTEVWTEIEKDKNLGTIIKDINENGIEDEGLPAALLGKFAKLEIFLTNPTNSRLLTHARPDLVSPKLPSIDRLIEASLSSPGPNNKVIVAVHYKSAAKHLFENSRFRKVSAYYDASKKNLIRKFQDPNSDLKVLFAVIQSIKEGLNLQIANRIIIADTDWTPGALKQLEARVFRPHIRFVGNDIINLNEGKTVHIDTVLCDNSADCLKFAFQTHKRIFNSIIMEECPIQAPDQVPLSKEALVAPFLSSLINGGHVLNQLEEFNLWNQEEIDQFAAKGDMKFEKVKHVASSIGEEKFNTPWINGMKLPLEDDEEPLTTYLESLGWNSDMDEDEEEDEDGNSKNSTLEDLTPYSKDLMGVKVRVEQGEGRIYSVRRGTIVVSLKPHGEKTKGIRPSLIIHKIGSTAEDADDMPIRIPPAVSRPVQRPAIPGGTKVPSNIPTLQAPTGVKPTSKEDASRNDKVIKPWIQAQGVQCGKKKNKSTGEILIYLDYTNPKTGKTVRTWAPVGTFRELTLGEWKILIQGLIDGVKNGSITTGDNVGQDIGKQGVDKALNKPSKPIMDEDEEQPKPKKQPGRRNLPMDDEEDEDISTPKAPSKPKAPVMDEDEGPKAPKSGRRILPMDEDDEEVEDTQTIAPEPDAEEDLDKYINDPGVFDVFIEEEEKPVKGKLVKPSDKVSTTIKIMDEDEDEIPATQDTGLVSEEGLTVYPITYNGIPGFASFDEDNGIVLQDNGFEWVENLVLYKVANVNTTRKLLTKLFKQYNVPEDYQSMIEEYLESFVDKKWPKTFPKTEAAINAYLREDDRRVKSPNLRLQPLAIGGELYLAVRGDTQTFFHFEQFHKVDGFWLRLSPNITAYQSMYKEILQDVSPVNKDEAIASIWNNFKIKV